MLKSDRPFSFVVLPGVSCVSRIIRLLRYPDELVLSRTEMSDIFRKSVLNRLPVMPPTRAPWAANDDDAMEELDGDDEEADQVKELGVGFR